MESSRANGGSLASLRIFMDFIVFVSPNRLMEIVVKGHGQREKAVPDGVTIGGPSVAGVPMDTGGL